MKAQILQTAKEILDDAGAEGISMRNIAASLNISATALYRHYQNKESIINELVKSGYELLMKQLITSLDENNAEKRLKACLLAYASFGLDWSPYYSIMYSQNEYFSVDLQQQTKKHCQPVTNFINDRIVDVLKVNKNSKVEAIYFLRSTLAFLHGAVALMLGNQFDLTEEEFYIFFNKALDHWLSQLG